MDAYDIFKKLTQGTRIRREKQVNSREIEIPTSENDNAINESNNIPKESRLRSYNNTEITLLKGMATQSMKGQKRKLSDPNEIEKKKRMLEQEEINHYRNVNNISVVGRHIPNPARVFSDLNIDKDIQENLIKCGYSEPTPIQKQGVPVMLEGRQLLACAPTGSGKTAAFLVPIIQHLNGPQKQGFRALILCPTRELASQTQRECVKLSEGRGFKIHIISKIKKALTQYGSKSNKKYDILITTPNRLCFLLNQEPPAIDLSSIQWLVIDEADKLFEDGSRSFRDQLQQILKACDNSDRKIAMFSATHTPVVAKWCVHNMVGLVRVTVGHKNAAVDTVVQELLYVGNEHGKLLEFRNMVRQGLSTPALIFVQSKERAQQLFNELIYDGINVDAIHSDRTQTQRDNTVRSFREGKIWVLICTELMARGVDFKGVNLVINYDFPPSVISYVHRIGRAGRAGRQGRAVTFFTNEDAVNLRSIAHVVRSSGYEVPDYMLKLKKQPKSKVKKLAKQAPERDEITTVPLYYRIKGSKKTKFREISKRIKSKKPTTETSDKKSVSTRENNRPKTKKISKKITLKTKEGQKLKKSKKKPSSSHL
ncbi:hypothetical protein GWI33_020500 [Rhynchophorus ferrugineus]|uniref:Probable ATP-dependent RNA helicase DDX52 n=1 Tax=Rhynchophorus ferrugineus TaxID=354439 RepID=A0A834M0E8_RHYFE|nr:hypothetical protein GWI33_020500 [Rhynchophorus ferrugineus]